MNRRDTENAEKYAEKIDDLLMILEPLHDIPENERWIYENPEIFESIKTGIEQSLKGDVKSLGTFSQYADE